MQPIKISIVEDHASFRQGLCSLFKDHDDILPVSQAANGKEFITCLPTVLPDIVLLDIEMPEMDGFATADHLRLHYPAIKIIVLTQHDELNFIASFIEKGAAAFLHKNSDIETLCACIRSVHAEGSYHNGLLAEGQRHLQASRQQLKSLLSPRETEVARLLSEGQECAAIAAKLFISPRTVQRHREEIMKKTRARNMLQLIQFALAHNLSEKLNKEFAFRKKPLPLS